MESPVPAHLYGPGDDLAPLGALEMWRRELRAGDHGQDRAKPATWKRDALFHAARFEVAGTLARDAGILDAAEACRIVAAQLIVQLHEERSAEGLLAELAEKAHVAPSGEHV